MGSVCRYCQTENDGGRETCARCGHALLDIRQVIATDRWSGKAVRWTLTGVAVGLASGVLLGALLGFALGGVGGCIAGASIGLWIGPTIGLFIGAILGIIRHAP